MASEKIQKTLAWLDQHEIAYEIHYHPAIYTIEDCLAYWKNIGGGEYEWLEINA